MIKYLLLLNILVVICHSGYSQFTLNTLLNTEVDTSYYDELVDQLTVKAFSSQITSDFTYHDELTNQGLSYKANSTRSLGVGVGYKWLGINFGYGFSFANQDEQQLGKTERIDLQTAFYLRKFTIRLYSSKYKGFYLNNSYNAIKDWPQHTHYTRPDIKNSSIGIYTSYIFNSKKYSNRAAFVQSEWQKKTAGSFLAGFNMYYNHLSADSSFVPTNIKNDNFFEGTEWNKNTYFAMGIDVGYVFTWVVHKHFFINFGLALGAAFGKTTLFPPNEPEIGKYQLKGTILNNIGMGYNSKRFYAGFGYDNFVSTSPTAIEKTSVSHSAGSIRFVLAYRFTINKTFLPRIFP